MSQRDITELNYGERVSGLAATKQRLEAQAYQLQKSLRVVEEDLSRTESALVALQGLDTGNSATAMPSANQ